MIGRLEHMTIASFEDKQSLDFEDVIKYPKEHIRCGTSFLFLIVFISLLTLPFIPNLNLVLTTITRLMHVVLVSMISYDLSIAAITFLIYIIYTYWSKPKKIFKYLLPFFVGFSLALPFYLYDTYESN